MKNIYTFVTAFFFLLTISVTAQTRVYAPDLRAPENGETEVAPDALLDWDAVAGSTTNIQYEVQLDLTDDFANAVTFPLTKVTSMNMEELMFGTTYYWHVRAYDGDDVSEWSETWSFTVIGAVNLKSPSDGAMVFPDPTVTWDPVTGLTGYQIQIDTTFLWSSENSGTTVDLNGAFIIDADNKWIVGDDGFVAHFDGTSWTSMDAGTASNLNAVWFTAANDGWFAGDGGTVIHYDGTTFTPMDAGTTKNLYGIYFIDENTGWAVGKSGTLLKYDGTWISETAPENQDVYCVFAVAANDVYAGAKKGFVFHYDGTSWSSVQLDGKKDVFGIWFTDAANGWAVGKSGKIFHFDGSNWTNQPSGITKDLYGVSFNASDGFAVGKSGYMLRYTNGMWEQVASGSAVNLNAVFFAGDEGIVAGNDGNLLKKAGEGFNSPYLKMYLVNKDSSNIQLFNLLFGKTFYYRVRALHLQDTSDWSSVKSMTTYSKPDLISPSNNASNLPLLNILEWQEFSGVIKYTIETSENPDFQPALTYFSDSSSILVDNFGFGKTYYWRVNAIHADDVSEWSDVYSFQTTNTIVLSSPENGAENVNKSPRMEWEGVDGVGEYQLLVADNENFDNAKDNVTTKNFFQCQSTLGYNKTYYWKVRGIAALDTSGWSPVWHFTTESPEGINHLEGIESLTVYPNPTQGAFVITVNASVSENYSLTVADVTGKTVYHSVFSTGQGETTRRFAPDLGKGIYTVTISDGRNSTVKKLFVR